MIQPDIVPTREPLMPQGILRVTEAAGGVLGHVHRMLGRGAVKEALAALRSGFSALSGGTWRSPARIGDPVRPAGAAIRPRLRWWGAP